MKRPYQIEYVVLKFIFQNFHGRMPICFIQNLHNYYVFGSRDEVNESFCCHYGVGVDVSVAVAAGTNMLSVNSNSFPPASATVLMTSRVYN